MRHDAHYVDDLSAAPTIRQVAISEIDRDAAPDGSGRRSRASTDSIRRAGILQPLLVAPRAGRFQLIDGGRRLDGGRSSSVFAMFPASSTTSTPSSVEQMRRNVNVPAPAEPRSRSAPRRSQRLRPSILQRRIERAHAQAASLARSASWRTAADVLDAELAQAATGRARRRDHARCAAPAPSGSCPRARSWSRRRSRRPCSAAWPAFV